MIDITKKSQCRAAGGLVFLSGRAARQNQNRVGTCLLNVLSTEGIRTRSRSIPYYQGKRLPRKEYFLVLTRLFRVFAGRFTSAPNDCCGTHYGRLSDRNYAVAAVIKQRSEHAGYRTKKADISSK